MGRYQLVGLRDRDDRERRRPAAHLVDRVWPDVPVRQWVLTLPYRVRWLCACDQTACRAVRKILVRAVSGLYVRGARCEALARPQAGAWRSNSGSIRRSG